MFFIFKQKTAYEMRISDWSSDVCSSDLVVRQRLRLGAISPRLMQVYRDGGLKLDQLMAFAITEDHARQEQVYDNLSWNKEPAMIRRMLMETHVGAGDRRAIFVGPERSEERRGGKEGVSTVRYWWSTVK